MRSKGDHLTCSMARNREQRVDARIAALRLDHETAREGIALGHCFQRLDRRTPMLVGLAIGGVAPVGAGTGATFLGEADPPLAHSISRPCDLRLSSS